VQWRQRKLTADVGVFKPGTPTIKRAAYKTIQNIQGENTHAVSWEADAKRTNTQGYPECL
jgi:hypothetical protein